eukprot:g81705.t1
MQFFRSQQNAPAPDPQLHPSLRPAFPGPSASFPQSNPVSNAPATVTSSQAPYARYPEYYPASQFPQSSQNGIGQQPPASRIDSYSLNSAPTIPNTVSGPFPSTSAFTSSSSSSFNLAIPSSFQPSSSSSFNQAISSSFQPVALGDPVAAQTFAPSIYSAHSFPPSANGGVTPAPLSTSLSNVAAPAASTSYQPTVPPSSQPAPYPPNTASSASAPPSSSTADAASSRATPQEAMLLPSCYAVPNTPELLPSASFPLPPLSLLVSPLTHLPQDAHVPGLGEPPVRCSTCTRFFSKFCRLTEQGKWRCCFCSAVNDAALFGAAAAVQSRALCFQYVRPASTAKALDRLKAQRPRSPREPERPAKGRQDVYLFLVDANASKQQYQDLVPCLGSVLRQVLSQTPQHASPPLIGLLVFGRHLALYDLGGDQGIAQANVCSAARSPSRGDLDHLFGDQTNLGLGEGETALQILLDCLEALAAGARNLPGTSAQAQSGHGGVADSSAHNGDRPQQESWAAEEVEERGLGAALEAALALLEAQYLERSLEEQVMSSRLCLTVLTTGPANLGPGATCLPARANLSASGAGIHMGAEEVEAEAGVAAELRSAACDYFDRLAERASRLGVQVDLHCLGLGLAGESSQDGFRANILQRAARQTGGSLRLYKAVTPECRQDLALCLLSQLGQRGTLEVYFPSGMSVRHVLGPVRLLKEGPSNVDVDTGETCMRSLLMAMTCTRPDDNAVTLAFALTEPLPAESVYIQVVVSYQRWTLPGSAPEQVVRVGSLRLRCTGSLQAVLDSLDLHVTATVLAKQA